MLWAAMATAALNLAAPTVIVAADPSVLQQLQMGAMSGDLRPVVHMMENIDEENLDPLSVELLKQYRARFLESANTSTPLDTTPMVDAVIGIYQEYWRAGLIHRLSPESADRYLQAALRGLLQQRYPTYRESENIFTQLENALAQANLGSSTSITEPWRDLYIWSGQSTQEYEVELTDGVERVAVTLIEGTLIQGWQNFASLDLLTTSGWATGTGLYCLCWSYDLESDTFRKSWLKHETRHLVDFREFPGLPETDMEYRAKLTELAFAGGHAGEMLLLFATTASANSLAVHAQANRRVSETMYRQIFQQDMPAQLDSWSFLRPSRVNEAARHLLLENTNRLKREEE